MILNFKLLNVIIGVLILQYSKSRIYSIEINNHLHITVNLVLVWIS